MSVHTEEAHEARARHLRDIERREREHQARMKHNEQHAYTQGFEDGAQSAHPFVSMCVGVVVGVLGSLSAGAVWRWVAGFFLTP